MSKGSMFWSQATGKVGDVVIAINKGQTITRKYQKNVTNPKTRAQMLQRARFANAVKFYKRAYSNFFKFAYEDKKQTESEYNAFMRHNTNTISSILKRNQVSGTFPAVGNGWQVSSGSLSEPQVLDLTSSKPYLSLPSLNQAGEVATIAEISAALISDYSLVNDDIITIVRINTKVSSLEWNNPTEYPTWDIKQFKVNTSDGRKITEINTAYASATGKGLYLEQNAVIVAKWYGVVFSRKELNNNLKVSDSYLYGNASAQNMYVNAQSEDWINTALVTWNVTEQSVLEGSLVEASNTAVIETCSGDAIPRISDTTFNAGIVSYAVLTGQNMSALKVSDFECKGVEVKEIILTNETTASIGLEGLGNYPTSWTLSYNGTLIAKHSTSKATISMATPSSVNVIDKGDSVNLTIKGENLDSLNLEDLIISDNALVAKKFVAASSTAGILVLSANDQVTSATVKYNNVTIFEVREVVVSLDTESLPYSLMEGANSITITGTGLDTLTLSSFTFTGVTPRDYVANSSAEGIIYYYGDETTYDSGSIKYGDIILAEYQG